MPHPDGRNSEAYFRQGACSSLEAMRLALPTSMACGLDSSDANAGTVMALSDTRATNGRRWPAHACSYPIE